MHKHMAAAAAAVLQVPFPAATIAAQAQAPTTAAWLLEATHDSRLSPVF